MVSHLRRKKDKKIEEIIIKDVRELYILKKLDEIAIKDMINLLNCKKKMTQLKVE